MRQVTLSDHTADQSRCAAGQRRANFEAAQRAHDQALQERAWSIRNARDAAAQAWAGRRYLAWLGCVARLVARALAAKPAAPHMAPPSHDEIVWNAGHAGEQRVADAFAGLLSDAWTLVSGYRNRGGEVDQLLIGPGHIVAIEIKFVNGVVHCAGGRWSRDKYDRYGNLVETGIAIRDGRGHSPADQVNAVADGLQAFLARRAMTVRVTRGVVLAHDRSQLGTLRDPGVDFVATLDALARVVAPWVATSDGVSIDPARALALVRRDHAFHENSGQRHHPVREPMPRGRRAARPT